VNAKKSSSEIDRKALTRAARRYVELVRQIKVLEEEKARIRRLGLETLDALRRDVLRLGAFKIQRYSVDSVTYDLERLGPILHAKGIYNDVIKVTLDEKKLEEKIEEGLITLEEISRAASVRKGWGFRVDVVGEDE
jgi:hypothetical protein